MPVWLFGGEERNVALLGDRTPVIQPVVNHYGDWSDGKLSDRKIWDFQPSADLARQKKPSTSTVVTEKHVKLWQF